MWKADDKVNKAVTLILWILNTKSTTITIRSYKDDDESYIILFVFHYMISTIVNNLSISKVKYAQDYLIVPR